MIVKLGQELQEVLKAASKSVREKARLSGAPLFVLILFFNYVLKMYYLIPAQPEQFWMLT
jgi:hypothetical protein